MDVTMPMECMLVDSHNILALSILPKVHRTLPTNSISSTTDILWLVPLDAMPCLLPEASCSRVVTLFVQSPLVVGILRNSSVKEDILNNTTMVLLRSTRKTTTISNSTIRKMATSRSQRPSRLLHHRPLLLLRKSKTAKWPQSSPMTPVPSQRLQLRGMPKLKSSLLRQTMLNRRTCLHQPKVSKTRCNLVNKVLPLQPP